MYYYGNSIAGGGGASGIVKNVGTYGFQAPGSIGVVHYVTNNCDGPGGGGAGSGNAQQGNYQSNAPYVPTRAQPGNINTGGEGGIGSTATESMSFPLAPGAEIAKESSDRGQPGQSINEGWIRNGGDAGENGQIVVSAGGATITAKGGSGTKTNAQGKLVSSGELIIYRTRNG